MQDLTHDAATGAKAFLVLSSMNEGNTVYADPSLAMTAPGSPSINPVTDVADNLPLPIVSAFSPAEPTTLVSADGSKAATVPTAHPGWSGSWARADGSAGPWDELP